jgi:D-amino peptidase
VADGAPRTTAILAPGTILALGAILALAAILTLDAPDAAAAGAADRPLKVFISADMEGIGGVVTWSVQAAADGREYEKFRRLMTLEVNAAVEGAFDAGATEVLVADAHGDAQNLDVELLDRRARLVRGFPRPLGMMQGIDGSFAAAVFVGYHGAEGDAAAILSHTNTSGEVFQVRLNGTPVPEAGFNAAIAAEFGVPVVFLSGDQTIASEAKRLIGPIETAVVKEATGFHSATMLHPEESRRLIREGVRRGIDRRGAIPLRKPDRPIQIEITWKRAINAELVSYLPGVERPAGNVVAFRARDMVEATKFFYAVRMLNKY